MDRTRPLGILHAGTYSTLSGVRREVRNVTASIVPVKGGLLLGQTFLRQFGSWSIDNRRGVLVHD
jgi:hypothetical protein